MSKKKCFGVLSSAVFGVLLTFGLTTSAHAAVKSYVVNDNGQIISFNLSNLLLDYTNNLLKKPSPMYDKYLKEASNLVAFEDDKKGCVSYDSVITAYEDALSQDKGSEFNVDTFTENAGSADIKNITANYECNQDGSLIHVSNVNGNTVDPSLIEAQNGLPKVQSIVKTQAEKDLVSALRSAVDTKVNNSSAVIDKASIKSQYNNLSSTEKSDFQKAMFDNFSIGTLIKIKGLL